MPFDVYLELTDWERIALLVEIDELIGRANEAGAPPPKDVR